MPNLDHPIGSSEAKHLDFMQLRKAIQEMKHLEALEISECCSGLLGRLNLNIALKELTIHTERGTEVVSKIWMKKGFTPPKLNLVSKDFDMDFWVSTWYKWNSRIPAGHIACLKVYTGYKAPLNLFNNAPEFQLQYGEAATLPFVQLSNVEINEKWLLMLTDHDDGSIIVRKARLYYDDAYRMQDFLRHHGQDNLDNDITNLTELDLTSHGHNLDFKQIVGVCPWLQRLNLWDANLKLEDLQVIAACCSNLQGLNLMGMLIQDITFCLQVWEILSGMMLTHLSINGSFIGEFIEKDNVQEKQLVALFKQCITLQALQLVAENNSCELLSHFSSLRYCRVISKGQSTCIQNILTTCEKLRYFYCSVRFSDDPPQPPLLIQNNLQQLCISYYPQTIHLDDNFMKVVSAHGGLIHVILCVFSVTSKGVAILINNSPNLLYFVLAERTLNDSFKSSLRKKFSHRKLFTSGVFYHINKIYVKIIDRWLKHPNLFTLWPHHPAFVFDE